MRICECLPIHELRIFISNSPDWQKIGIISIIIMKRFLPLLILILLLAPVIVLAQCPTGSLPDYCYDSCGELLDYGQTCAYRTCCIVIIIAHWSYFIAAGLALLMIIWAGIMYMTAAGDETKAGKAKKILLYGIIGAIIVWASGYILSTIVEFLY